MASDGKFQLSLCEVICQWQEDEKHPVDIDWHVISQRMVERAVQMTPFDCYVLWMRLAYRMEIKERDSIRKDEEMLSYSIVPLNELYSHVKPPPGTSAPVRSAPTPAPIPVPAAPRPTIPVKSTPKTTAKSTTSRSSSPPSVNSTKPSKSQKIDKPHVCCICNNPIGNLSEMEHHIMTTHSDVERRSFASQIAAYGFPSPKPQPAPSGKVARGKVSAHPNPSNPNPSNPNQPPPPRPNPPARPPSSSSTPSPVTMAMSHPPPRPYLLPRPPPSNLFNPIPNPSTLPPRTYFSSSSTFSSYPPRNIQGLLSSSGYLVPNHILPSDQEAKRNDGQDSAVFLGVKRSLQSTSSSSSSLLGVQRSPSHGPPIQLSSQESMRASGGAGAGGGGGGQRALGSNGVQNLVQNVDQRVIRDAPQQPQIPSSSVSIQSSSQSAPQTHNPVASNPSPSLPQSGGPFQRPLSGASQVAFQSKSSGVFQGQSPPQSGQYPVPRPQISPNGPISQAPVRSQIFSLSPGPIPTPQKAAHPPIPPGLTYRPMTQINPAAPGSRDPRLQKMMAASPPRPVVTPTESQAQQMTATAVIPPTPSPNLKEIVTPPIESPHGVQR